MQIADWDEKLLISVGLTSNKMQDVVAKVADNEARNTNVIIYRLPESPNE